MIKKVISGGQCGADLGALYGARKAGLPTGGTAPYGWISGGRREQELLQSFGLREGEFDPKIFPKRTMKNVDDADGTLAILWDKTSLGTAKTIGYCQTREWRWMINPEKIFDPYKPYLIITTRNLEYALEGVYYWLLDSDIKILNVAGNRETSVKGIQNFTEELIFILCQKVK